MQPRPVFIALLLVAAPPIAAAPQPHPDRPDRLVERRDGFSVEYSPGQEPWMELAFERLRVAAAEPPATWTVPTEDVPAVPGSARDLRERRNAMLAAIAQQIGLSTATELQGRTFDTFLGYYELLAEALRSATDLTSRLSIQHVAIWHRDDLRKRLRNGATIEGFSYDLETDSAEYSFQSPVPPEAVERIATIRRQIDNQRLKHTFASADSAVSASVTLGGPADPRTTTTAPSGQNQIPSILIAPVVYGGEVSGRPDPDFIDEIIGAIHAATAAFARQAASYTSPTIAGVVLHETAEVGLVENVIGSPDRRWLCDGTANYVQWRVTRDLIGPEFARQVYDLDAQLRRFADQQPQVDLAGWSAAEDESDAEDETNLARAHYAFAARAMFMLAEQRKESALAELWADVARTPKQDVTADTFAQAYRERFGEGLSVLINAAETRMISAPAEAAD